MQKRLLPALLAAAFFIIIIDFGCTKIDTTTLGSDLVTVDNVNTFADTMTVNATQGFFNDSTIVKKTDTYVIGNISAGMDPIFGTTTAAVYVQFKPNFYPFYFGTIGAGDTIRGTHNPGDVGLDSVVLCLSYKGAWGDTTAGSTIPETFEVRQINDMGFRNYNDSLRKLTYQPNVNSTLLGSAIITPQQAQSQVYLGKGANLDSVSGQIRIKLNASFANSLFNQDSSAGGIGHAFYSDSLFRDFLHGFAVTVNGAGKTLFYVNLAEQKSRLEFSYRKKRVNGIIDTTVESFQMYPVSINEDLASSSSDYIKRDYTGAEISNPLPKNVYLQTSPGTYASLQIPELSTFSNHIIHRAYLVVEQRPASPEKPFSAPPYLYLDLKDTSTAVPQRYKPIYFDLNPAFNYNPDATDLSSFYHPYPASNVDLISFGAGSLDRVDATGAPFARYELNITRYVQHIVTNGYHNYDLRLYAPYNYYYPQYPGTQYVIPYYNPLAQGRVRVGTGDKSDPKAMKLVIVYSKIP